MYKLGIDFHGVLDKHPVFFKTLMENKNISEIHIITGTTRDRFNWQLKDIEEKHSITFDKKLNLSLVVPVII